jgi:glutamyl-tRNA(Gln) amidotransferase subunit D
LIYTYPGISSDDIEYLASKNDGIVFAGSGLGHAPGRLLETVQKLIRDGIHIVMTSQCLYGRVNMNVYSNGRDFLKAGVIPAEDMLPETAFVKLMWVLGQTDDAAEVKKMMLTNYVGEITDRTLLQAF